jgi:hypothetical protein
VESLYHANVTLIGKAWNALNFTGQAALYNSFSHVIAPHGAQFANLIFTRPGTHLMELVCSLTEKNMAPNALGVTVDNPDLWYNTRNTRGHQVTRKTKVLNHERFVTLIPGPLSKRILKVSLFHPWNRWVSLAYRRDLS